MLPARMFGLAVVLSGVFSAAGCYYKVQNFGYTREIGIGRVGCQVPIDGHISSSDVPSNQASRPIGEENTASTRTAASANVSAKSGNHELDTIPEAPPTVSADVPPPNPASSEVPRPANSSQQRPRKGWVGLPDF